ncbi:fructosamine kinase [Sesbania bispinosa]|nr:fructosamine kinase [Sesbania bispinosa]
MTEYSSGLRGIPEREACGERFERESGDDVATLVERGSTGEVRDDGLPRREGVDDEGDIMQLDGDVWKGNAGEGSESMQMEDMDGMQLGGRDSWGFAELPHQIC